MENPGFAERVNAAGTKEEVIAIIKASGLPKRFKGGLLQTWAQAHGVVLTGVDYAAVVA